MSSFKEVLDEWQQQYEQEQSPRPLDRLLSGSKESVSQQREHIRLYMNEHVGERFDLTHPWATVCARCAHHLDASPVKSAPEAPHCLWAKGKRRLQFRAFVPREDGQELKEGLVPFCQQYAPDREWAHIVPEGNTQPAFSRPVMLSFIRRLAKSVNRNVYSTDCRAALQFLTGRPESASERHRQTFKARLQAEEPMLSDRQTWTLLQWLLIEWERVDQGSSRQMMPGQAGLREAHVRYFSQVIEGGHRGASG